MISATKSVLGSGWHDFVIAYGWRAYAYELAAILGQSVDDIERIRRSGACIRLLEKKGFSELFSLWYGRPPEEEDWPPPRKFGGKGTYEWQGPELALLASLVGRLSIADIAQTLTTRLRKITGDPKAVRSPSSIQVRMNKIGLQTTDVLGGITITLAGREIGSSSVIRQAIRNKTLPARRVGRLLVIPYDAWETWKSKRDVPPKNFIPLSSIRQALAIRSDKLSEFARMGYIPTANRYNLYGAKGPSTKFGTWYIDKKIAEKLVADRRVGNPMPWHGKPMEDNLRATFKLWNKRKHPPSCKTCADIWGKQGTPRSYEEYTKRYPLLAHGEKRHLTRQWDPGLTISEVAKYTKCTELQVRRAIRNGMLDSTLERRRRYVSRTDATRWKARKCPIGENTKSWLSLETASNRYLFTCRELRKYIDCGKLKSKIGINGAARNIVYVSKHQCAKLREEVGFTEKQAAKKIGVSVTKLHKLLEGVNWRKAKNIPLVTVQAAIKRLNSREGYTISEAAKKVGKSAQWVQDRIKDGTIKVVKAKWDRRRLYISAPMLKRLQEAKKSTTKQEYVTEAWLLLNEAAIEAGVSITTIMHWFNEGELKRQRLKGRYRYHRKSVRSRARIYWENVRFHRAKPPKWLV